jgi:NADH dehydrogenase/NADH:ubiquinone oxidoreductase subunit G
MQIQDNAKLMASCVRDAWDGMEVSKSSDRVKEAHRNQ